MSPLLFRSIRLGLAAFLWWRSRPARVRRALAGREFSLAPPPGGDRIRVASVQLQAGLFHSAEEYAQAIYVPTRQAVEAGAQLVVFPEESAGYALAGLLPGLDRTPRPGGRAGSIKIWSLEVSLGDLLRLLAPAARRVFEATFSALAAGFGVHLAAGSAYLPAGRGRLLKAAYLFGPDGRVIGSQAQTHLSGQEVTRGLGRGEEIRVAETALGRISIILGIDQDYFEPQRIAWLRGAEIVAVPSADQASLRLGFPARGLWGRVQESPAYGILACLVGDNGLGMAYGGRSGIYAPLEITPHGDGIIAQAASADRPQLVVADLDLAALRRLRRERPPQFNLELYRRYLPAAYATYRRTERDGRRVVAPPSPD